MMIEYGIQYLLLWMTNMYDCMYDYHYVWLSLCMTITMNECV